MLVETLGLGQRSWVFECFTQERKLTCDLIYLCLDRMSLEINTVGVLLKLRFSLGRLWCIGLGEIFLRIWLYLIYISKYQESQGPPVRLSEREGRERRKANFLEKTHIPQRLRSIIPQYCPIRSFVFLGEYGVSSQSWIVLEVERWSSHLTWITLFQVSSTWDILSTQTEAGLFIYLLTVFKGWA